MQADICRPASFYLPVLPSLRLGHSLKCVIIYPAYNILSFLGGCYENYSL